MLQRNGDYKGNSNEAISEVIIQDILGSPILLYSDRMNPDENEKAHQRQLDQVNQIQKSMAVEFQKFQDFYRWPAADSQRYLDQLSVKLKGLLTPRIEETYRYFKNASRFVGRPLQSDAQCLKSLGID